MPIWDNQGRYRIPPGFDHCIAQQLRGQGIDQYRIERIYRPLRGRLEDCERVGRLDQQVHFAIGDSQFYGTNYEKTQFAQTLLQAVKFCLELQPN